MSWNKHWHFFLSVLYFQHSFNVPFYPINHHEDAFILKLKPGGETRTLYLQVNPADKALFEKSFQKWSAYSLIFRRLAWNKFELETLSIPMWISFCFSCIYILYGFFLIHIFAYSSYSVCCWHGNKENEENNYVINRILKWA